MKYLFLLFIPTFLFAEIREIARLNEILPLLESRTLVVFDIDNTLLEASQQLGSVAWADYMVADFERKGISHREAMEIESVLWTAIQPHIAVRPVDPETVQVLNQIHKQKSSILCLTSRTPQELDHTLSQLNSIGIAFTSENILFCTPHRLKSEALLAFLHQCKLHPDGVIFIDDKYSHVCDVHRGLEEKGIFCMGLRFNGADRQHLEFDPRIAEIQWRAFPHHLPDEVARMLL